MPLHHVNASDAENFDALGVVITGMNFSGDEDQSRRNEDTAPKCIRSAANERGENNIMSERSHIESPHEHSASFNASYSSSNDINIRDSRYSFSSIGSSSHNYGRGNTHTSQRQEPIYEDADQNSGLHSDIHASSKQNTAGKQQKHTTEEDETQSISTIDDSYSVTGQQQSQYYASRSNNLQQSNRFRQSRQRSDADNSSVTSSSACRSQENLYSSQLETRVTKLSLELATTKALLDHAQLEHRRIKEEKDELKLALSALESENEQLHLLVEKLEKEKLLATMEKTVGVAHSVDQLRSSFVSAIEGRRKEDKNFQVTTFRAEPRGAIKHKVRRSRSRSGGELEVPFSNRNNTSKDLKNSFQRSFSDDSLEMSMGALSLHSISDPDLIADEIQKEEYSEDDPFSTWSAPEDRPKEYGRQNIWFGKVPNNPHRHDDDDNNDMSGDPFDTCSKSADSMEQALSDNSSQQTSQQEQRGRGFPLFRGLRGNRGHR